MLWWVAKVPRVSCVLPQDWFGSRLANQSQSRVDRTSYVSRWIFDFRRFGDDRSALDATRDER